MGEQVVDLKKKIDDTQEQMVKVISQIDAQNLITKETKADDALKELRAIMKAFDTQSQKMATYNHFQEVLSIEPTLLKENRGV